MLPLLWLSGGRQRHPRSQPDQPDVSVAAFARPSRAYYNERSADVLGRKKRHLPAAHSGQTSLSTRQRIVEIRAGALGGFAGGLLISRVMALGRRAGLLHRGPLRRQHRRPLIG